MSIVFSYIIYSENETTQQTLKLEEKLHIQIIKHELDLMLQIVKSDLMFLADITDSEKLVEAGNKEYRKDMADIYLSFSKRALFYDQIRFIDKTGMELVRVNFNNGNPINIPKAELQNKRNRYYFKEAFSIKEGKVYASPFDLNVEHGKIEKPFKPMIRFGTPLFDKKGIKQGVIIVNFIGSDLIKKVKGIEKMEPQHQKMLVNSQGYWLASPNEEDEWGFMFEDKKDRNFRQVYPDAWANMNKNSGQFHNSDGLFTFATLNYFTENKFSNSLESQNLNGGSLSLPPHYWKIINIVPASLQDEKLKGLIFSILPLGLTSVFGIIILSAILARQKNIRARQEEKIRKLYTAIEQSPVLIMITDMEGKVEYVNPTYIKVTGYSMEEVMVSNPITQAYGEKSAQLSRQFASTLLSGKEWKGEFQARRKSGELYWERTIISPVMNKKGEITGFVSIEEDITQEKETELKLEKTKNQLISAKKLAVIGELAEGICHEILNPTNIISITVQLLLKKDLDGDIIKSLEKLRGQVSRIETIARSLSTFSQTGKSKPEPTQINKELEKVATLFSNEFELSNIKLATKYDAELPEVSVRRDEMHQVFLNLFKNAKEAMPHGGNFNIETRLVKEEKNSLINLVFTDTGIGIAKENLEKIFDPFFTTKSEIYGTGMGLFVCFTILEKHGGTINVESTEGKGTEFIIKLATKNT